MARRSPKPKTTELTKNTKKETIRNQGKSEATKSEQEPPNTSSNFQSLASKTGNPVIKGQKPKSKTFVSTNNLLIVAFSSLFSCSIIFSLGYIYLKPYVDQIIIQNKELQNKLGSTFTTNIDDFENLTNLSKKMTLDIDELKNEIKIIKDKLTMESKALNSDEFLGKLDRLASDSKNHKDLITEMKKETEFLREKFSNNAYNSQTAISYQSELKKLKESIKSQENKINEFMSTLREKQEEMFFVSQESKANELISQIGRALDNGAVFSNEIQELEMLQSRTIPLRLKESAKVGVATMFELTTAFPDFARKTIIASRKEKETPNQNNLIAFIKTQLKARSLKPVEGDSTDAILSRAEFKLKQGDLAGCLEELKNLDVMARDSMSEWTINALNLLETINSYKNLLNSFNE